MAICEKKTVRKFRSHDTFVAVLGFCQRSLAVHTVLEIRKSLMAIIAFTHPPCATDEITVLRIPAVIGIFAILTCEPSIIDCGWMWDTERQCLELFKKCLGKIKLNSIIERIPFVAPPGFYIVDRADIRRIVEGNN